MIRVIEGTPGSGKTCWTLEMLLREIDRGFYKEFYSNIEDLKVCGVRHIPPNFDWRTLNPDKMKDDPILVIYDEAQYEEPFMKENRSVKNEIGKDLSTHRHYGIDMWLITQSNKLLNDYVLSNTGEHIYMYRPRKKKSVKVYWWSHIQKTFTKATLKSADDEQTWRLNPHMFSLYKSTSGVTDGEARKSGKLTSTLITAVGVFMLIGFMVFRGVGAFTQMQSGQAESDKVATVESDKIASTLQNGETNDKQPLKGSSTGATISDNINSIRQDTARTTDIYNPLTGGYYTSGDIAVSGAVMVDGECWAYNVKAQRILIPSSECSKYLESFGNMANVANPVQPKPISTTSLNTTQNDAAISYDSNPL